MDIVARTLAAELSKSMGQTVLVENRPSAASLVGTQAVAKAAPDGYTLLAHSSTFFTAPVISANAGYDAVKDLAPITLTCKAPMFMEVHPSVPARNRRRVRCARQVASGRNFERQFRQRLNRPHRRRGVFQPRRRQAAERVL